LNRESTTKTKEERSMTESKVEIGDMTGEGGGLCLVFEDRRGGTAAKDRQIWGGRGRGRRGKN